MAVPIIRQRPQAAPTSDSSVPNEAPSPAYSTNGVAAYTPAGVENEYRGQAIEARGQGASRRRLEGLSRHWGVGGGMPGRN